MKHQLGWKSGLLLSLLVAMSACAAPAATTSATPAAATAEVASAETMTETVAMTETAGMTETEVMSETSATVAEIDRTGWPEVFRLGFFGGDDAEAVMEGNAPLAELLEKI